MGYQFAVTDFAHEHRLDHICRASRDAAAERAGAPAVASRIGCIVALTRAGLARARADGRRRDRRTWQALCRPGGMPAWTGLPLAAPMWTAMVLAMMLPTAGPMILTYAEIADTAARKARAGGVAAGADRGLCGGLARLCARRGVAASSAWRGGRCSTAAASASWLAARCFSAPGLYQFSALKQACLTLCQRPFPFFFSTGPRSAAACCGSACGRGCSVSAAAGR